MEVIMEIPSTTSYGSKQNEIYEIHEFFDGKFANSSIHRAHQAQLQTEITFAPFVSVIVFNYGYY